MLKKQTQFVEAKGSSYVTGIHIFFLFPEIVAELFYPMFVLKADSRIRLDSMVFLVILYWP